jgi:hypothetical protein
MDKGIGDDHPGSPSVERCPRSINTAAALVHG